MLQVEGRTGERHFHYMVELAGDEVVGPKAEGQQLEHGDGVHEDCQVPAPIAKPLGGSLEIRIEGEAGAHGGHPENHLQEQPGGQLEKQREEYALGPVILGEDMAIDGYAVEVHCIQHLRSAGAGMQMAVLAAGVVFDWAVEPQEGLRTVVGSMESRASLVSSCVKTSWRRSLPVAPFRLVRLVEIWPEWWYPAEPGHVRLEGPMEMCSGWPFRSAHPE